MAAAAAKLHFECLSKEGPMLPVSGHAAATLPCGDVLVLGGYTEDGAKQRQPSNEAWRFCSASRAWSKVAYAAGATPQPRLVAQAVVVGSKLWLIGGWNSGASGADAFLGDVWTLDLDTMAWAEVELDGEALQPASRHQAVAVGSTIWIHTHRCSDHVLALDTAASPRPRLAKVPVAGPGPSSRGLHSMVHVDGKLLVFGGAPQQGPMLNDVYCLDLATMAWRELHPSGDAPHVRCSTAAGVLGDRVVYVGGAYYGDAPGLTMLRDCCIYDAASNAWLSPAVSGSLPAARNAAAMVSLPGSDSEQGQLLLFGGWEAFKQSFNDTWLLTLTS